MHLVPICAVFYSDLSCLQLYLVPFSIQEDVWYDLKDNLHTAGFNDLV